MNIEIPKTSEKFVTYPKVKFAANTTNFFFQQETVEIPESALTKVCSEISDITDIETSLSDVSPSQLIKLKQITPWPHRNQILISMSNLILEYQENKMNTPETFKTTLPTVEDIQRLAENQKQIAAALISRHIFKVVPSLSNGGFENISKQIVDAIVNAAILEITALQKQATSKIG